MGHMLDDRRESPDTSDARVSRGSKWRASINTAAPQHEGTEKELEPPTRKRMFRYAAFENDVVPRVLDIPGGLTPESLS